MQCHVAMDFRIPNPEFGEVSMHTKIVYYVT